MNSFFANILSPKKLQSQTISREQLRSITLSYKKAARKMLVKMTPNVIGFLRQKFNFLSNCSIEDSKENVLVRIFLIGNPYL